MLLNLSDLLFVPGEHGFGQQVPPEILNGNACCLIWKPANFSFFNHIRGPENDQNDQLSPDRKKMLGTIMALLLCFFLYGQKLSLLTPDINLFTILFRVKEDKIRRRNAVVLHHLVNHFQMKSSNKKYGNKM